MSLRAALLGGLGGVAGAETMSVVRLAAHRAGLIEKTVPQAVEEWAADRAEVEPPGGKVGHQVAQELLHVGYGLAWGAAYGSLLASRPDRRRPLLWGAGFGALLWALGLLGLLPALGVARPAHRADRAENAVNVTAHVLYGVAVQLLAEELGRQPGRRATSDPERAASRVG
jgi:hypothetical protein